MGYVTKIFLLRRVQNVADLLRKRKGGKRDEGGSRLFPPSNDLPPEVKGGYIPTTTKKDTRKRIPNPKNRTPRRARRAGRNRRQKKKKST